jgi:chloramphenicol 3-O phosphotransferase
MAHGTIIVLNGTSSAGKSALAQALQDLLPGYPIHTGIDHFHERAPGRIHVSSDGLNPAVADGFLWVFPDHGDIVTELRVGPIALKLWAGMHAAVAALAAAGNDVIVDDLLFDPRVRDEAIETLYPFDPLFVGVRCPLDVAERRERERDRTTGLARALAGAHDGCLYDVEVDTSVMTPQECATVIRDRLAVGPPPDAFCRLKAALSVGSSA